MGNPNFRPNYQPSDQGELFSARRHPEGRAVTPPRRSRQAIRSAEDAPYHAHEPPEKGGAGATVYTNLEPSDPPIH